MIVYMFALLSGSSAKVVFAQIAQIRIRIRIRIYLSFTLNLVIYIRSSIHWTLCFKNYNHHVKDGILSKSKMTVMGYKDPMDKTPVSNERKIKK